MVKVKVLSRSEASVKRECVGDVRRMPRNLNPAHHPMQRSREYQRAVVATKIDRMFAKPLIGSLGLGHADGVTASATSRRALAPFVSGAADGTIVLWDLSSRKSVQTWEGAHQRAVSGLVFARGTPEHVTTEQSFYSCSTDGKIHLWDRSMSLFENPTQQQQQQEVGDEKAEEMAPLRTWTSASSTFYSIDHHWKDDEFATASDQAVEIWSPSRSAPLQRHVGIWGSTDTVQVVRYNPAEPNILGSCSADRGVGLWDLRSGTPLRKTILNMRSNALEWNPMEPMHFIVANDDFQLYSFDMRNLSRPTKIYKGHTNAVMDVAWSPTGREFATASYDRTTRIFGVNQGTSRDIYHAKRMQRVFTVQYTLDNKYILTGSDDTNLRIWKARSSDHVGQLTRREESSRNYRQALVQKYQHLPEVRRIHRARRIPKVITKDTKKAQIQKEKATRKLDNRIKNSKEGTVELKSERDAAVVKEID